MYHLRFMGPHYQMGEKRGRIFQRAHITFPLHLDGFQLEHGRKSEEILRGLFPEVCREIEGVSDTLGVEYMPLAAWMLCMGCCMYNLRENIPVEVRGCTAFSVAHGDRTFYGRNNDLPPYLRDGCKSELYAPQGGNRFLLNTSSFINGEEGLNEHGLAVGMTFVMTRPEKIRPGLNSCFIVRYLLEKADSVDDAHGDDYNSAERYRVAMDSLREKNDGDIGEKLKSLLRGEFGFMCQYDDESDFETVWSSIFDLKSLRIYRAEGDPRKTKFITDDRLCKIVRGI